MTTDQKIEMLREQMQHKGIDAYIVVSSDPHLSEYLAPHWKTREWLSSFTGSAGTLVVTDQFAGLWTDSRYFIQAQNELNGSCIELVKLKKAHTPEHIDWLHQTLKTGDKVGIDSAVMSVASVKYLNKVLSTKNIQIIEVGNLANEFWTMRPLLPYHPTIELPTNYCGESREEKLRKIRQTMQEKKAQYFVQSALDEIAWTYNLRGSDIEFNPVSIAYSLITKQKAFLYIDKNKLADELRIILKNENIEIKPYTDIYLDLNTLDKNSIVLLDENRTNQSLYAAIPTECKKISALSVGYELKAVKNKVEQLNIKAAMIKDGVALIGFFMWLEENVGKTSITEYTLAQKIASEHSKHLSYKGESFAPIVGYEHHGAIVHYSVSQETASEILHQGILLIDCGAQYLEGTTDISRTISMGNPSAEAMRDFTLVLKGHIHLSSTIFPAGTTGSTLDVLARQPLWQQGLNYGHGTGHGVGHFLNVHEGPQSFGAAAAGTEGYPLKAGMIITIEPGLYRADKYGIRTENIVLVEQKFDTDGVVYLGFEPLTLFPIDTLLIDFSMLNKQEIDWLNNYHSKVYNELSPFINEKEKQWLLFKTQRM